MAEGSPSPVQPTAAHINKALHARGTRVHGARVGGLGAAVIGAEGAVAAEATDDVGREYEVTSLHPSHTPLAA